MDNNNPNFELTYKEEDVQTGLIEDCAEFLRGETELKMRQMNVCGIVSKHSQLEILLEMLGNFDCIILTETHTNEDTNLKALNFPGFDGVEIDHLVSEIKITDTNCLEIKMQNEYKKYICLTIYRSPSGSTTQFLSDLKLKLKSYNIRDDKNFQIIHYL